MIVKEYAPSASSDRFRRAGDEAEQQMAHYLRRAFGDDPGVHIFHHLRLEHGGETAQIDHLVLHRAGLIVVESKSVTSSVRINARDEWAREWRGHWNGMPSPVLQARRQAELLRALLDDHRTELRRKVLLGLVQGGFGQFIIDVVVAISDRGVIDGDRPLPEVKKADQVTSHLRELIAAHGRAAGVLVSRPDALGFNLSTEELDRVRAFLMAQHQEHPSKPERALRSGSHPDVRRREEAQAPAADLAPVRSSSATEAAPTDTSVEVAPATAPSETFRCGKCSSTDLEIKFGHSYYFRCRQCSGNTPIKLSCPSCGAPSRTRKNGRVFSRECSSCQTSAPYFTNPT